MRRQVARIFGQNKLLAVLFCLPLLSLQGGCKPVAKSALNSLAPSAPDLNRQVRAKQLMDLRSSVQNWALRCGSSVAKEGCDVGDAVLFNGLLCLTGDRLSCDAVRASQGSDGRMWRAAVRVDSDRVNSFSRDMALGVLAYLVATRDQRLAERWLAWIEKNNFRLCTFSTDNRCEFTPGFWMLFREVWSYLGLPLNAQMRVAVFDEAVMALLQAEFSPPGFQMHLAGVNALIRKSIGQNSPTLRSLAVTLANRQPDNPFFAYLVHGAQEQVVEKTLRWCPAQAPAQRKEWSFERDTEHQPWRNSMGWECIMLVNLMLNDLKGNIGVR